MRIPCGVEFIKKDLLVKDPITGKQKRKSSKTKNELAGRGYDENHRQYGFDKASNYIAK